MHANNTNDMKLKESNHNEQKKKRRACRELSIYALVFNCLNFEYELITKVNDYL